MLDCPQPDVVRRHPCLYLSRVPQTLIAGASHTHHVPNCKDAFSPFNLSHGTLSSPTLQVLSTRVQAGQRPGNRPAGGNQHKWCRRAKA